MDANRTSRKAVLLVLLIFVLGVALGALGTYVAGARVWGARSEAQSPNLSHHDRRARLVEQLKRDLALSADQQKQLDAILSDAQSKYQALHEQIAPQSEQVRQQVREQIRGILTPEQKPKYEEFVQRLDEKHKKKSTR